jgi:peptide/nickel transport system substrate-binding protein
MSRFLTHLKRPYRAAIGVGVAAALAIVGLTSALAPAAATASATSGGTVSLALQAGVPINYIFPFMSSQYVNSSNGQSFQDLMYRPLYWWDGSPYQLNAARSLAAPPTFTDHNTTVVIHLKSNWKFSDGEHLTPANVAFFLGMLVAERTSFWMYLPGEFPDTLKSASYSNSQDSVTLHLTHSVNPTWFLQNQLTMITPLPTAWDLSGPGTKSDCASESAAVEAKDCPAVYKYLSKEAANTGTYATNPLWQVVDGPFRLSSFASGGTSATLVPNTAYSGTPKPRISKLVLDIATSDASEFSLLASGSLTIGYVPFESAPVKPVNALVPPVNPVSGDTFEPATAGWSYNDLFWNYNNPQLGPLLHQLYFRQAMQSLVDQKGDIEAALRGYGYEDFGPNPPAPANQFETPYEKSDPYAYSLSAARKYLTTNGWNVPSSGRATCVRPGTASGDCGQGITKNEQMPAITLQYTTGSAAWPLEMTSLQSAASRVGIDLTPVATPEANLAQYFAGCTAKQASCKWQMIYLGTPETDTFTFYPETGVVFRTHAIFNVSNYSNPYVESLFDKVYAQSGNTALDTLDNYLTRTCALLWAPVPDTLLYEVSPKLKGFTPSPIGIFEPENWYFTK